MFLPHLFGRVCDGKGEAVRCRASGSGGGGGGNKAKIIGGVVGGLLALLVIGALVAFLLLRRGGSKPASASFEGGTGRYASMVLKGYLLSAPT